MITTSTTYFSTLTNKSYESERLASEAETEHISKIVQSFSDRGCFWYCDAESMPDSSTKADAIRKAITYVIKYMEIKSPDSSEFKPFFMTMEHFNRMGNFVANTMPKLSHYAVSSNIVIKHAWSLNPIIPNIAEEFQAAIRTFDEQVFSLVPLGCMAPNNGLVVVLSIPKAPNTLSFEWCVMRHVDMLIGHIVDDVSNLNALWTK